MMESGKNKDSPLDEPDPTDTIDELIEKTEYLVLEEEEEEEEEDPNGSSSDPDPDLDPTIEKEALDDTRQTPTTPPFPSSSDSHPESVTLSSPVKPLKFANVQELKKEMARLGLSLKGNKEELKKRYRKYLKKQEEKEKNSHKNIKPPQPFKYYCVIDYEATCEEGGGLSYPNEIIEFPALLIRSYHNTVIDEFHEYVKPKNQPILTEYCKELTGITQEQVDTADDFPKVLKKFEQWLDRYSEFPYHNVCFVTDGPWDIRDFIRKQCMASGIERPPYFYKWNNLRKTFKSFYRQKDQLRLNEMLTFLGMSFEGHEHCGLDDTRNITRIVQRMLDDHCHFKYNIKYPPSLKQ